MRSIRRASETFSTKTAVIVSRLICWMILATSLAEASDSVETPWGDEIDAVGRLEIAEGVVGGDDPAAVSRKAGTRPHLRFQLVELLEVGAALAS